MPEGCFPGKRPGYICMFELGTFWYTPELQTPFYSFHIHKSDGYEFYIMSKKELDDFIKNLHEDVYIKCEDLLNDFGSEDSFCKIESFLRNRLRQWDTKESNIYDLEKRGYDSNGFITKSWEYEYYIFNLIYIYKTFDWENDYLIYSAG